MDAFCQKVTRLVQEEKFAEILTTFKSKAKNLNSDEIQYFYQLSVTQELPVVSLLVLKLRLKLIRNLPDLQWAAWIQASFEFLGNFSHFIEPKMHKQLFGLARKTGEICAEIGKNDLQCMKQCLKVLMVVLETRHSNEITSIHYLICRLALASKKLFEVEDLINRDYIQVSKSTGIKPEHCMMFFYYIGSIALILKKYSKAYSFYELAISTPSKSVHSASVESYKKLVLLRLLIDGTEYHPGRLPNQRLNSVIRSNEVEPYTQLANFFSELNKNKVKIEDIMTHINKYSSKWASDQNQGLIKRLQLAIAKQKITKLTKVYSSLTFDQVITETKVENAESILIAMVENHEIHAKINKKLKLVVFEDRDDEIELDQIQDVCTRLIETTKFIENNLAKVTLDKNYLKTTIGCENLRTG